MTQEEILEGNKLIAEFMKESISFMKTAASPQGEYLLFDSKTHRGYTTLKYSSSWDWLMPVVEKIENFCCVTISYLDCWMTLGNKEEIVTCEGGTKIEATYKAVIEFIKWYNQQKL